MPASIAKQVASMFLGVIFANKTHMGKTTRHIENMSPMISVQIMISPSERPYAKFCLVTNRIVKGATMIPIETSQIVSVRSSKSFSQFRNKNEPMNMQKKCSTEMSEY